MKATQEMWAIEKEICHRISFNAIEDVFSDMKMLRWFYCRIKKKKPISPSITRNIWYITPIKMQLVQVKNSTLCRMCILNHLDLPYMCLGGKTFSFGILPAFAGTQSFLRQIGFCSCVREAFKSRASKIKNKKVNRQKNPFGYDPEQWLPLLSFWTSDVIIRIGMISWARVLL